MASIKRTFGEYLFVLITFFLGLTATLFLTVGDHRDTERRLHEEFRIAASDRINVISAAIQNSLHVSHSVVSFFKASDDVSRNEFGTFAAQILKDHPFIEALEWAPRVPEEERVAFEARTAETLPGFALKDVSTDGQLIPSLPRRTYFPITYIEPVVEDTARVFGVDFMSSPVRREAIDNAIDTGKTAVTRKVTLLSSRKPGVLFFSPVYKQNALQGMVATIIPLPDIISGAIAPLNREYVNIIAHDVTEAGSDAEPLFTHASRLQPASEQEIAELFRAGEGLRESTTLDVGSRKWRITVMPSAGHYQVNEESHSSVILAVGVAFTLMLGYYMLKRIRENVRISRQVESRTEELRRTKKEVELILHSTSEGIIGLDAGGTVTFSNGMAGKLLGYSTMELYGKDCHALIQYGHADGEEYVRQDSPIITVLAHGGEAMNVESDVFWCKSGRPLQVEYTVSAMMEKGEVAGAVIIFRDITERKLHQQKLEQMARNDQLTGLANRRLFLELLHKTLARAERSNSKVGVIYIDLNDFKPINDTMGHAAGDMLLKQFGMRLSERLREYDTMARLGGDEFAILIDNITSEEDCESLLNRLLDALNHPFTIAGQEVRVTASIGVSIYPTHAVTLDALMGAADDAMYEAKKDKSRKYAFSTQRRAN